MKSETNPKTVMLKDYIIDMDSVSAKVTIDYEVVLENNTDFIVKRRTLKTDRELVVLVSKGIFYIKDCKTDHVDPLTETNLSSFLRDLKERCITLHQVHWLHTVFRESVDFIMNVITDGLSADAAGLLRESQGEIPGAFQNRARYYGPESQSGETDRYMRKLF